MDSRRVVEGRALLDEELGGATVRHVALPWGVAGEITRRALADTGHATAFAQRPLKRLGIRTGDDRYALARLNGKFITCLPGHGRRWFLDSRRRMNPRVLMLTTYFRPVIRAASRATRSGLPPICTPMDVRSGC